MSAHKPDLIREYVSNRYDMLEIDIMEKCYTRDDMIKGFYRAANAARVTIAVVNKWEPLKEPFGKKTWSRYFPYLKEKGNICIILARDPQQCGSLLKNIGANMDNVIIIKHETFHWRAVFTSEEFAIAPTVNIDIQWKGGVVLNSKTDYARVKIDEVAQFLKKQPINLKLLRKKVDEEQERELRKLLKL
jgi:hypothetical protein